MSMMVLTSKTTGRQKLYVVLEIDRKKQLVKVLKSSGHHDYFWLGRDDIQFITIK